ncbi:hypothetical protein MUK71_08180 [Arthrobacter zhangbolii]|uniref:Uncharacterized protein n=1 Tax=Arthrobacter zhangbolii TaxID=2886936 RepID=A0A9X1M6B7_9MICC|nr:hypothetical protein [Arthrobacter zhangbolii]MCC3271605.1 hypothetical protein [Arthrobacter zhangbolii]MCC3293514.1 hypothetical protein [Arthrobacter zhangbolii]UON90633.1 hypothetical protein MUK71_08180 [Arthrobacter zhangbolii]
MKALKRADLPVLIVVWMLCVATDWSTGTKIALNVFAVALLCAKEFSVHRYLVKNAGSRVSGRRSAAGRLVSAA